MKASQFSRIALLLVLIVSAAFVACSKKSEEGNTAAPVSPLSDKGIGPVKSLTLGAVDPQLAAKGQQIFQAKCSACHKMDEKYVGPALLHVTHRRSPEWIMNMVLNPQEMTEKDPIAKDLLATHLTQMTFQNVSEEEARSILEYFRQNDSQAAPKAP